MKLMLSLSLLLSLNISAQVKPRVLELLDDIKYEVKNTNDRKVLMRVQKQLERSLDVLIGNADDPRPNPRGAVSCVARDNDGRAPWVLGSKDPVTLKVTKLPASNLGNINDCNRSKEVAINIRNSIFACVTKDNDGRAPYSLAHYRNSKLIKKVNNMGTLDNCIAAMGSAIRSQVAVAFCATRDNDGKNPWIEMSVVAETGKVHKGSNYSNLNQCLSSAKSHGSNGLMELLKKTE